MFVAELVPQIAFGSVAGVFVDRWDRKRTMVVANLILTVAILPLVFVRSADEVWIVYLVAFTESLVARFLRPAEGAMLPRLVDKSDLVAANALGSFASNTSRLVGPTLGGVIAGIYGLTAVAGFDSVTFAIAAALVALVRTSGAPGRVEPQDASAVAAGLVIIAIVGVTTVAFGAGFNAILQTSAADAYRGRLLGAIFTTMALVRLLSTVLAGVLGSLVSPIPLLVAFQAGSYVALGLVALGFLPHEAGRAREELAPAATA